MTRDLSSLQLSPSQYTDAAENAMTRIHSSLLRRFKSEERIADYSHLRIIARTTTKADGKTVEWDRTAVDRKWIKVNPLFALSCLLNNYVSRVKWLSGYVLYFIHRSAPMSEIMVSQSTYIDFFGTFVLYPRTAFQRNE